jgi:hypothetical protein
MALERIDCSICLEEIKDTQRITVIRSCQHGFHELCLQPWLQTKSTCPNCRGPLRNEEETLSHQRQSELNELDRVYLTYTLFTWVLQNFNGVQFKRHSNAIHEFLSHIRWNSIRPLLFPMTSRNRTSLTSIKTLRVYCVAREQVLFNQLHPDQAHRVIHRNPRNLQIQREIQQELTTFAQRLC